MYGKREFQTTYSPHPPPPTPAHYSVIFCQANEFLDLGRYVTNESILSKDPGDAVACEASVPVRTNGLFRDRKGILAARKFGFLTFSPPTFLLSPQFSPGQNAEKALRSRKKLFVRTGTLASHGGDAAIFPTFASKSIS